MEPLGGIEDYMSLMIGCLSLLLLSSRGQAKTPAPEFFGSSKAWIQGETSLSRLRGKVVVVDFWDSTCVNCIRTFPYVKEWYRRYKPYGFEIVAIHTPEFAFEKPSAAVKAATKRFGFTFPVLNDPDRENWKRYSVTAWPTKLLLDSSGVPVWSHMGEGDYPNFETRIQKEILKTHPGAKLPPVLDYMYDVHRPGAVCYPCTPEMFAGARGLKQGDVAYSADQVGKSTALTMPKDRKPGVLYFEGAWLPGRSGIAAKGEATSASLRYAAKEVNSVMKATQPVEAEVFQDGRPLEKGDAGADVKWRNGRPTVKIQEARMYSLVKNAKWGRRELRLDFHGSGVEIFSFSFSTDCMALPKKQTGHGFQ